MLADPAGPIAQLRFSHFQAPWPMLANYAGPSAKLGCSDLQTLLDVMCLRCIAHTLTQSTPFSLTLHKAYVSTEPSYKNTVTSGLVVMQ